MNNPSEIFTAVSPVISAAINTLGSPVAGSEFTLSCTVSENIPGLTNQPNATWLTSEGEPVTSSEDITVTTVQTETTAVTTLTFNPLRVLHRGVYRCVGTLASPALESPFEVIKEENLVVQGKHNLCAWNNS